MELKPSEPPGHASRKLREYSGEIHRLRNEGYTIRAIHQALKDAGVKVSWASVQREATRLVTSAHPSEKSIKDVTQVQEDKRGQDKTSKAAELESYFGQHNANPLLKRGRKK